MGEKKYIVEFYGETVGRGMALDAALLLVKSMAEEWYNQPLDVRITEEVTE